MLCTQQQLANFQCKHVCTYANKLYQPHTTTMTAQHSLYRYLYKLTGTPLDPANPGTPILPYSNTTSTIVSK